MHSLNMGMLIIIPLLLSALACMTRGDAITEPNFPPNRTVIVHLFEWRWDDVAAECERFLAPYGYAGVQVASPAKHKYFPDSDYPWWERYQPVSYELISRSGTREEFADMVRRCNDVDVRVYVDAVINHMAADPSYSFPEVPYNKSDFNVPLGLCPTSDGNIHNYSGNPDEVRYCNLLGLCDIYFGPLNDYYGRDTVVDYLNDLLEMGVAGFRVDAAKHMVPDDLIDIASRLNDCTFGGRPYVYQEVIDRFGDESIKPDEYFASGDVTEFKYCDQLAYFGRGTAPAAEFQDVGFGESWNMIPDESAVVFVENHDNQRNHGGGGDILSFQDPLPYKKAVTFLLAWPYGTARIMSSYVFENTDQGPPSDSDGNTDPVVINSEGLCDGGWVCEHRWPEIANMACFRNLAASEPVENWWDDGNNFIAFSRGNKAFYAMNNENIDITEVLQTGLPGGTYCDLISGRPTESGCSGTTVVVADDGTAEIALEPSNIDHDAIIALTVTATSGRADYEGCQLALSRSVFIRFSALLTWVASILACMIVK